MPRSWCLVLAILLAARVATAATFTVKSTADSGAETLRAAITAANADGIPDDIAFEIPGAGVHTITLLTPLPTITQPVTIDGYTQPGSIPNTLAGGTNAVLRIEIKATYGSGTACLLLTGGSSTVRGLVINDCPGAAIQIDTKGGNVVAGNFLGTDPTGTIHRGRNSGVFIRIGGNTIGGTTPADRNLIHSQPNVSAGAIQLSGFFCTVQAPCPGNVIQGNLIGTNAAGTAVPAPGAFPTAGSTIGVYIGGPNINATVGGPTPGARNVISGTLEAGLRIESSDGNVIEGNYIGTDVTGTVALRNARGLNIINSSTTTIVGNVISGNGDGMRIDGLFGPTNGTVIRGNRIGVVAGGTAALGNTIGGIIIVGDASNTAIGGTAPGQGNTIAFNGSSGNNGAVLIAGGTGNAVLGNAIHSNDALGIALGFDTVTLNDPDDVDAGANLSQNFPVITAASVAGGVATVSGTLNSTPSTSFRVELFASVACNPPVAGTIMPGHGEGQTFLGFAAVVTDAGGDASFGPLVLAVPPGQTIITATATDPAGNTSEFSACLVGGTGTTSTTVTTTIPTTTTIATTTTVTTSSSTTSTTTTLPPPAGGCAFLVQRVARYNNAAVIDGDLGANDPKGLIRLGRRVRMGDGTTITAPTVAIGNASRADVVLANEVRRGRGAVVNAVGPLTLPLATPFCPIPPVECGVDDVDLPKGSAPRTLPPGSYGAVRVADGTSLDLAPGSYRFCSLKTGRNATIRTLGAASIAVRDDVRIENGSTFGPAPGASPPTLVAGGRVLRIGTNAEVQAFISAPAAQVRLGSRIRLAGSFCADTARSGRGIHLGCVEAR
jgi:hypothetical protein